MIKQDITPETLKDFSVVENGRILLHVGLVITLYIDEAHLPDKRKGLIRCFEYYWRLCGEKLKWASVPQLCSFWVDLSKEKLRPLREWVPSLSDNEPWSVTCVGGRRTIDASALNIEILSRGAWKKKLSYITATLPFVWFSNHAGSLPELVHRWCEWTLPYHGYAGLGIISSLDEVASKRAEPQVYALAQRFPGLEVDYPVHQIYHLKDGIKGVNWLTILGDRWVEKLGGQGELRRRLEKYFVFHDYGSGFVVQAGPHPQLGDAERNDIPQDYRTLSRLLKPIRVDYPFGLQHTHDEQVTMDRSRTKEWLARFD